MKQAFESGIMNNLYSTKWGEFLEYARICLLLRKAAAS
jgi:hypothetical protein